MSTVTPFPLALGIVPWLLGLLALAGALFLLQRLRVRHRDVPVVTTLFWREAVEATRARVLVRSFRHPLAYVLFVAIAALLWTAVAQPGTDDDEGALHVVLLDASAGMAFGDRYARAQAAAQDFVRDLPSSRRLVMRCGATHRTLLAPGESALLLTRRLAGDEPDAAPASLETALAPLVRQHASTGLAVHVVGDAPLDTGSLPDGVVADVADLGSPPVRTGNVGIQALGVTPAASGAWRTVDLYARVTGDAASVPSVTPDLGVEPTATKDDAGLHLQWRDVPAQGQVLTLRVPDDGVLAVDDEAMVRLPDRAPLRVSVHGSVDARLRAVLTADPAVEVVTAEAQVQVGGEETTVPTLRLAAAAPEGTEGQSELLRIHVTEDEDAHAVLAEAYDALGLGDLDAARLADATRRPVEVGAYLGPTRAVVISSALLDPELDVVGTRAFPLLVSRALRWLGQVEPLVVRAAVGESLATLPGGPWRHATGTPAAVHALGAAFTPTQTGTWTEGRGRVVAVSLLDPALAHVPTGRTSTSGGSDEGSGTDLVTWLLLLGVLGLLAEWLLFRTGRVP